MNGKGKSDPSSGRRRGVVPSSNKTSSSCSTHSQRLKSLPEALPLRRRDDDPTDWILRPKRLHGEDLEWCGASTPGSRASGRSASPIGSTCCPSFPEFERQLEVPAAPDRWFRAKGPKNESRDGEMAGW